MRVTRAADHNPDPRSRVVTGPGVPPPSEIPARLLLGQGLRGTAEVPVDGQQQVLLGPVQPGSGAGVAGVVVGLDLEDPGRDGGNQDPDGVVRQGAAPRGAPIAL